MKPENKIHIGTSGWSYKHWKGVFYPESVRAADYLNYYSEHFPVTEINASFYRLPTAGTVEKWVSVVPEGFKFCPKMSKYLSHMKKLHDPEEPLERFFGIFDPVQQHLGPILIQLPASLGYHDEVARPFFKILSEKYSEHRFALEVRHESWYSDESIDLMKKHNIAMVIAQSGRYPYREEITARDIFLRFHGPGALYSSSYEDQALEAYAEKFADWAVAGHHIWAFFNNDNGGHAIRNAETLTRMAQEKLHAVAQ